MVLFKLKDLLYIHKYLGIFKRKKSMDSERNHRKIEQNLFQQNWILVYASLRCTLKALANASFRKYRG